MMTIAKSHQMAILIMTITFFCGSAIAAEHMHEAESMGRFFERGDHTLTISGSGSSDHEFDSNVSSIELDLATFLTDSTAIAIRQGVGYADTRGNDDWNASTRLALDYFIPFEPCVPFVGLNFGYLYGDNVNETFIAGPELGLRHILNETTFINILVEYQFLFEDADEADEQFDEGRFVYTLGLGVRL